MPFWKRKATKKSAKPNVKELALEGKQSETLGSSSIRFNNESQADLPRMVPQSFSMAAEPEQQLKPVPKVIHHFWQGKLDPLKQHISNLNKIADKNSEYTTVLHVLFDNPKDINALQPKVPNILVKDMRNEAWFTNFQASPRYQQFKASREGGRPHLASGADIIKTELIFAEGGIWNDVDNKPLEQLPTELRVEALSILTAGPTEFKRWDNILGVHSSTFGTYRGNPILKTINDSSYKKYSNLKHIIYQNHPDTNDPDNHFKMISETAGSLHFSTELKAHMEGFNLELNELHKSKGKSNDRRIIMDKYFAPTTTTGAGDLDEDQLIKLMQNLSPSGHVVI